MYAISQHEVNGQVRQMHISGSEQILEVKGEGSEVTVRYSEF